MKEKIIITLESKAIATGMALNEFAAYRANTYQHEKHYFIAYGPHSVVEKVTRDLKKYQNIKFYDCQGSLWAITKYINEILKIENGPDNLLIHAHHPYSAFFFNLLKIKYSAIPVLYTVHNTYENYALHNKFFTNINILGSEFTTFCGLTSYKSYPYNSLFKYKCKHIPNGVNIDRIDSIINKNFPQENDGLLLTTMSKRNGQKNIPFLIKLVRNLNINVTLKIIGPLDEETKKIKDKLENKDIIFTGLIERDHVYEEIQNSDVFISASFYEGLPIGVLEAMATSTPVVLSDIPSHREILNKGEGPILKTLDLEDWIGEIARLNKLGKTELKQLGKKNRHIVENNFSLAQMHKKYSVIYNMLIN